MEPYYMYCLVMKEARFYDRPETSSSTVMTIPKGVWLYLYDIDSDHFVRTSYSGRPGYVSRANVNTGDSYSVPDRNATNMFGSTTLKYEKHARERREVYNLQWVLFTLGYNPGTPGGKFGKGTDSAVRAFQKAYGLTVDGKAGSKTKKKLIDVLDAA